MNRLFNRICGAFAMAAVLLVLRHAAAKEPSARLTVDRVASVGMTVRDVDRSTAFYRDVLGFEQFADQELAGESYERMTGVFGARARIVAMRLGDETIELTEYLAPRGRPMPEDSRSNDLWFQHIAIVVRNMDAAYRHLRQHRVEHISSGPERLPDWNPKAGGIEAFYFRDPDGHALEVIHFPVGKGDPKWRRPSDKLFMGIDHTAIAVSDTAASLRFYQDHLGMKVVGESENYGTEQEHLNNVFGARLRITTLRAQQGPGIELLEYLAPRDGRSRPAGARSNDILHWQTEVAVAGAGPSARLISDPDGHVLKLVPGQAITRSPTGASR